MEDGSGEFAPGHIRSGNAQITATIIENAKRFIIFPLGWVTLILDLIKI